MVYAYILNYYNKIYVNYGGGYFYKKKIST